MLDLLVTGAPPKGRSTTALVAMLLVGVKLQQNFQSRLKVKKYIFAFKS